MPARPCSKAWPLGTGWVPFRPLGSCRAPSGYIIPLLNWLRISVRRLGWAMLLPCRTSTSATGAATASNSLERHLSPTSPIGYHRPQSLWASWSRARSATYYATATPPASFADEAMIAGRLCGFTPETGPRGSTSLGSVCMRREGFGSYHAYLKRVFLKSPAARGTLPLSVSCCHNPS